MAGDDPPASGANRASEQVRVEPHEGYIFLDEVEGGGQILTHTLMLRRWRLPDTGPWDLIFKDRFGMLVSTSSDEVLFLEEWLESQVVRSDTGHLMVVHMGVVDGKYAIVEQVNLHARMREHEVRNCRVLCGGDELDLEVFTIARPRCSARLLWGLFPVYRMLGLKSYKGQPSKWAYNSFSTWENILQACGFGGCIVKSWQGLTVAEALEETDRVLPTPAIASIGLVYVAFRWCGASSRKGGLRDPGAVQRATDFLRVLCAAAHIREFEIVLSFDFKWVFRWPRPDAVPDHCISPKVSKAGLVDMGEWASLVRDAREFGVPLCAPARLWFGCIEHLISNEKFISLPDFFVGKGLADMDIYQGMAAQMAKVVGERVEMAYY